MHVPSPAAGVSDGGADAVAAIDPGSAPSPAAEIPRHPALAIAVVGLVALAFVSFGSEPRAFVVAFAAATLAVLAAIDIVHRVLPNRIVGPAAAILLAAQVGFSPDRAPEWALAGVAAAAFLALPLAIRRDAVGMGDIKLGVLIGIATGWKVFLAIMVGCLAMIPVALVLLVRQGSFRNTKVPFGPFLAIGTILVLFASGS